MALLLSAVWFLIGYGCGRASILRMLMAESRVPHREFPSDIYAWIAETTEQYGLVGDSTVKRVLLIPEGNRVRVQIFFDQDGDEMFLAWCWLRDERDDIKADFLRFAETSANNPDWPFTPSDRKAQ